MSGGGARAAYQVGFVRYLAREFPQVKLPILTGVSAGAINTAYLAARPDSFVQKAADLARLWQQLTVDQVFKVESFGLLRNVLRVGLKLSTGGASGVPTPLSLVDTTPLWALTKRVLQSFDGRLPGIAQNIESGSLRAVALTSASYTTGRSVTWVEGQDVAPWERAHRMSRMTPLQIKHVMASASLPIMFPAVRVDDSWYGDGGMRLTSPLAPAVHLGAERILAISTRCARDYEDREDQIVDGYPPPAAVIGTVLNSIFLDLFDADALRLERINDLIRQLPTEDRGGMREVDLLVMRPSRDLGQLANDYEAQLPGMFRFLVRGLGTKEVRSNDLLSLTMFQPDYLTRLIELGEADAEDRREEIAAFLSDSC
jgi:NTE family protein